MIVTTLPMPVRLSTDICKSYGLVFRQSSDLGIKRLKPTPDKETLLRNLDLNKSGLLKCGRVKIFSILQPKKLFCASVHI